MKEKERRLIFKGTQAELRSIAKDLIDEEVKQATQTCLEDEIKFLEDLMPVTNGLQSKYGTTVGISKLKPLQLLKIMIKKRLEELKAKVGK
jgi:hypothetical protein